LTDIPDSIKGGTYNPVNYPDASATGPFYLAFGFTVNPNAAPAGTRITYYIKDVALIKEDGTKLPNDDLRTADRNTTLGKFRVLFHGSEAEVTRTLEPEPEPVIE
jgi:hypothetical protein